MKCRTRSWSVKAETGHRGNITLNSVNLLAALPPHYASLPSLALPSPFSFPPAPLLPLLKSTVRVLLPCLCRRPSVPVTPTSSSAPSPPQRPSTTVSWAWVLPAPPPPLLFPFLLCDSFLPAFYSVSPLLVSASTAKSLPVHACQFPCIFLHLSHCNQLPFSQFPCISLCLWGFLYT